MKTLREVIESTQLGRRVLKWWDHTDYTIVAPCSLDDEAEIKVRLRNADGTSRELTIPVEP